MVSLGQANDAKAKMLVLMGLVTGEALFNFLATNQPLGLYTNLKWHRIAPAVSDLYDRVKVTLTI